MGSHGLLGKSLIASCSLALAIAGVLTPGTALATDAASSSATQTATGGTAQSDLAQLQKQADSMLEKIEQTTATYQQAIEEVEQLEEQISQNESRTEEIAAKLPEQRSKTAASIKSLYIFQQSSPGLLDLILSSESFNDFITTLRYIDAIHSRNTAEIKNLTDLESELNRTQAQLAVERDTAIQKQQEALDALEEARAARRELQARANAIAASEAAARSEAISIARAAVESANTAAAVLPPEVAAGVAEGALPEATFTTSSGNTAVVQVPSEASVSTEPLTTNTTSAETGDWAARIDSYLAGSPLEGYGATFAEAAAAYGVDPRLSPAIATIESGQGAICFQPHNAWGWGNSSWSDWESAIYEQVEGLANNYDGTLTLEGAERYCPPNYQEWYSSVASEMDSI